jgi:diguanylate cyclase (GGDEF)-like protein
MEFAQAALDALSAHVAVLDGHGRIVAVNAAWRRFATGNGGAESETCVGTDYLRVCETSGGSDAGEASAAARAIRLVLAGRRREMAVAYPCHSPKRKRWFMLRVTPYDGPGPGRVVVAHENITAPKAAQMRASSYAAQLSSANQELERAEAFESARARILEMIALNELSETVLGEITGLAEAQLPGTACAIVKLERGRITVHPSARFPQRLISAAEQSALAVLAEDPISAGLFSMIHGVEMINGEDLLTLVGTPPTGCKVRGALVAVREDERSPIDRKVLSRVSALASVAFAHECMHERISFQANYDILTELPNRLLLNQLLEQAIAAATADQRQFAVVVIDIDGFRQVNELHGSQMADLLLRAVSRRLRSLVAERDRLARFAADQFVTILDDVADPALEALIDTLREAFQTPFRVLDKELTMTACIGVSTYPQDGDTADRLLRHANAATDEAKRLGRGSWRRFEAAMGAQSSERASIAHHLDAAIRNNEFELYYQAQVNSRRRIVGLEALMRWNSPYLGPVSPARFIPVAEERGDIVQLGVWALRQATSQARQWMRAGLPLVPIAVNVSGVQVGRGDLDAVVAAILSESGLDPQLLELEITETAIIGSLTRAIGELEAIRRLGVRISIDDFGTGFSSLSTLRTLPVDAIKIDRSFVQKLGADHGASSVVDAIVTLAHNLHLKVVAEGVESEEQFRILEQLGCEVMQGYWLHRPASANALAPLLAGASGSLVRPPDSPGVCPSLIGDRC